MVEDVQLPTVTDLSFDYGTVRTHFTITAYQNTDVVAISNIGKIGQVVQVGFLYFAEKRFASWHFSISSFL